MPNKIVTTLVLAVLILMFGYIQTGRAAGPPFTEAAPIQFKFINWDKKPLRTIYASPAGSGNGAGRGSPKALKKVLPGLRAGDRVILLPGNYPSVRVSAKGTADRPIRIQADRPVVSTSGSQISTSKKTIFKNSEMQIVASSYLRIEGISFEVDPSKAASGIEVLTGHHLAFARNYFYQNTNYGVLLFGNAEIDIAQVLVENNVFRNKIRTNEGGGIGGVRMDYGLRVHGTTTVFARNNLFDGYFNHAVSLKERVKNAWIYQNVFKTCGKICIEGGQEPDTTAAGRWFDRTVANVIVSSNRFDGKGDGSTGVYARNVERLFVNRNKFNGISYVLRVGNNSQNARSCERQQVVVGRMLKTCERNSKLTLTGRKNAGTVFKLNQVNGGSKIIIGGRGYQDDFLAVINSTSSGKVEIARHLFVVAAGSYNSWTKGLPATRAAPRLFIQGSKGFVAK